jgi:hypothetical protein
MAGREKKGRRSGLLERVERLPPSQFSEAERAERWRDLQAAMSFEGMLAEARKYVADVNELAESVYHEHGHKLGDGGFAADHELSFAENMLVKVTSAEGSLEVAEANRDTLMLQAFLHAVHLAEAYLDWREEFLLGDFIAPTLLQHDGRAQAGMSRAQNVRDEREPEWKRWQVEADKIWEETPSRPKIDVARIVIKRLRLTEKPDTVKRRIEKTGRS